MQPRPIAEASSPLPASMRFFMSQRLDRSRSRQHQHPAANGRRHLRVGVQERRTRVERARRRAACLQYDDDGSQSRACRRRSRLRSRTTGRITARQRAAFAGAIRLVSVVSRLSSVLSEPPPANARLRRRCRCVASRTRAGSANKRMTRSSSSLLRARLEEQSGLLDVEQFI